MSDAHSTLREAVSALSDDAKSFIEQRRQQRLAEMRLMDRVLDESFGDLVRVAASACGVSVAQINLLDEARQVVKARFGAEGPLVSERKTSICNLTIQTPTEVTHWSDCAQVEILRDNPWVQGGQVRFYAGVPLLTDDGVPLGTLCAWDGEKTHALSDEQRAALMALARLAAIMLMRVGKSPFVT